MDNLKFRAFSKKYNEYISIGFSILGETTCFNLIELWYIENKGVREGLLDLMLHDVVIEQFTGIMDSNGNEIYKGDVISYTQALFNTDMDKYPTKRKEVKWNNLRGAWNIFETNAGESDLLVIGNINLNKELLESK